MFGPDDFAGEWRVTRRITDRQGGPQARFAGTARFVPVAGGLDYAEDGLLHLGDGPGYRASRRYRWRWDGDGVAVLFDDGRPFHRFAPGGAALQADHLCGDDLYRVLYDFARWPVWTAAWDVTGPRKDYRLWSCYDRPDAAAQHL